MRKTAQCNNVRRCVVVRKIECLHGRFANTAAYPSNEEKQISGTRCVTGLIPNVNRSITDGKVRRMRYGEVADEVNLHQGEGHVSMSMYNPVDRKLVIRTPIVRKKDPDISVALSRKCSRIVTNWTSSPVLLSIRRRGSISIPTAIKAANVFAHASNLDCSTARVTDFGH